MIFGDYPCCGGSLAIAVPDKTPAYFPENCPHCGAKVWHRLSRINPVSWTEADFLAEHIVDEETKQIRDRNPPPELSPLEKMFVANLEQMMVEDFERRILYGDPEVR